VPLVLYMTEHLTVISDAVGAHDNLEKATEEYEKMGPHSFKVSFKRYRAEQAALHPGLVRKKVECPVTLIMACCEACGKAEETEASGSALLACARCKKARSCDRNCQAEDWKAHKPFCSSI